MTQILNIIGGGMAGSEAAWQAANMGLDVVIHEMRPVVGTFAHQTGNLAEMVCSNSFRSDDDEQNAVGLLHWEMRAAGGLIMDMADAHALPAGGALAVDRDAFAEGVTARLRAHPRIRVTTGEITTLPRDGSWIIATGPLTSGALAESIRAETGADALAFFDAIAPIVYADSIDMSQAWMQSRYDKGETEEQQKAYLNCPMNKDQYEAFIDALLASDKTEFHEGETAKYFDGCLPIEVMAERGRETPRHGPMKPVGLTNPHQPDVKAHAIVQLRRDNKLGTLYNIVGFQTKMKYGAQTQVLRMIPGLQDAQFARLGGIHRNTFLNSPTLLDAQMRLKSLPNIRFAGQITGVEGYVESAAMGLLAGRMAAAELLGQPLTTPPPDTAMGALVTHITGGAEARTFQPMNVNFGLFPPVDMKGGRRNRPARYKAYTDRAKAAWTAWLTQSALDAAYNPRVYVAPMTKKFLSSVYDLSTPDQTRALYDDWSASYDAEIAENGYATPARVAEALARHMSDKTAPILDFGCGTGLSGLALRAEGFTDLHGADLSADMLKQAAEKHAYDKLWQVEPGDPLPQGYAAITATGVIGVGAAPVEVFDVILAALAPGGLFALSFNDHALADPQFEGKLRARIADGTARLLFQEYGTHLPGIDLKSNVYILEKT